jgi:hypothetical protein
VEVAVMLLADLVNLDLSTIPTEVIQNLINGLQHEMSRRKALKALSPSNVPIRKFAHVQQRFGFRTYEEEIAHLTTLYSSALYALSRGMRQDILKDRVCYLPMLLAQDWSSLFPQAGTDTHTYYVYAHVDPRKTPVTLSPMSLVLTGEPFYIGKGTGQRAWDLKRNQGHGKRIQRLRHLGYTDTTLVSVLVNDLTERDAFILEAKLIYFFGSIYDDTVLGCLLNLADHIRPAFTRAMARFPTVPSYHRHLQQLADDRATLIARLSSSQHQELHALHATGQWTMADLAERYNITRQDVRHYLRTDQ